MASTSSGSWHRASRVSTRWVSRPVLPEPAGADTAKERLGSSATRRASKSGGSSAGKVAWGRGSVLIDCLLPRDRKSTRLNSSHVASSYAVFCLKQKTRRFINDAANSADRSDTWNSYGPDSVQVSREFERNRRRRELLSIV